MFYFSLNRVRMAGWEIMGPAVLRVHRSVLESMRTRNLPIGQHSGSNAVLTNGHSSLQFTGIPRKAGPDWFRRRPRTGGRLFCDPNLSFRVWSSYNIDCCKQHYLVNRAVFKWPFKKLIPKWLLRPITTGENSAINWSEFLAVTHKKLKVPEKIARTRCICFGFASHWLKIWREIFKPINKRSNRNFRQSFENCS